MPKEAISVTLQADNLTWLKARARSARVRSVSGVLDRLVTHARTHAVGDEVRSVIGTIDVDPSDPLLLEADDALRTLVAESVGRPFVAKERRPPYGRSARKRRG